MKKWLDIEGLRKGIKKNSLGQRTESELQIEAAPDCNIAIRRLRNQTEYFLSRFILHKSVNLWTQSLDLPDNL